jgi:hypothetical protein
MTSLLATPPGRLKEVGNLKQQLCDLGFGASFGEYTMCDPRWSPELSIQDYLNVQSFDVSQEAEDMVVRYLQSRGVSPHRRKKGGWADLLGSLDLDTSAGFGFTQLAQHKRALVLSYADGIYQHYQQWYESLPQKDDFSLHEIHSEQIRPEYITSIKVKEEISKITKVVRGDYRTFFCTPTFLIFEQALQTDSFAEELTAATFMFKGDDMRQALRELAMTVFEHSEKYYAVQGDASKMDRTLSRPILQRCFNIMRRLGWTVTPDVVFATLHPVVFYLNSKQEMRFAKFSGPHTSGYRLTTEFGGLSIFLCAIDILIHKGCEFTHNDLFHTGVGDDWTFISKRLDLCKALLDGWSGYGLNMKSWLLEKVSDWDFLGSTMLNTPWGLQPHWDLDKSAVRLSYVDKRHSDFDYLMRVVCVLQYNFWHPKFKQMYEFLRQVYGRSVLSPQQVAIFMKAVSDISKLYTKPQVGGSMGGTNIDLCVMDDMDKSLSYDKKAGVPTISASYESVRPLCSTDAGARWLETAVDPFHDRIVPVRGLPDEVKGNSLVQIIQRRVTISAPTGVTGKWDAQVFWTGELNNVRSSNGNLTFNYPSPSDLGANTAWVPLSTTAYASGGVEIVAGAMGADLGPASSGVINNYGLWPYHDGSDPVAVGSTFPSGGYRVVAGGIEIYDTTPELYRSGSLTAYRLNQIERMQPVGTTNQAGTSAVSNMPAYLRSGRLASAAQALLIPGSRTWRAPEGLYMPFRINVDAGLNYPFYGHYISCNPIDSNGQLSVGPFASGGTTAGTASLGNWYMPSKTQPMGAILTGLDNNVTFDVVVKFVIEVFPSARDTMLITLAAPTPVEDEDAMQAYKKIVEALPIAVPVIENSTGTWLKRAMNAMRFLGRNAAKMYRLAEPGLKLVAGAPGMPLQAQAAARVALVSGTGARVISNEIKKAKKAKKKKQQASQQSAIVVYRDPQSRPSGRKGRQAVNVD